MDSSDQGLKLPIGVGTSEIHESTLIQRRFLAFYLGALSESEVSHMVRDIKYSAGPESLRICG
jgi:hypothetical protein